MRKKLILNIQNYFQSTFCQEKKKSFLEACEMRLPLQLFNFLTLSSEKCHHFCPKPFQFSHVSTVFYSTYYLLYLKDDLKKCITLERKIKISALCQAPQGVRITTLFMLHQRDMAAKAPLFRPWNLGPGRWKNGGGDQSVGQWKCSPGQANMLQWAPQKSANGKKAA